MAKIKKSPAFVSGGLHSGPAATTDDADLLAFQILAITRFWQFWQFGLICAYLRNLRRTVFFIRVDSR